jgi:dTDP-4-amino-4,6-dideoxygalactose transaminase
MTKPPAFSEPIYVNRPLLPDLDSLVAKLRDIWSSQWLTNNGPQHQSLEKQLVDVLKVPHLSLFNNGTIALITACQSLRLSGEVITTPFTFPATPHVLAWNNIRPIFCDIDPVTMNIDANKIESMITPQTTGILAVHVYGTPCDIGNIQAVADRYGIKVIYDAAHAFGVEVDEVGIGNFGDITMFSFHATKLYHSAEGGALAFRDKHLKARIDLLKNFGIQNEEVVVMPGINGKMNEIQAALGSIMLNYIDAEQEKRRHLARIYRECLHEIPGITLPLDTPGVKSSQQYFVIRIDRDEFGHSRDEIYDYLKQYNVFTRKYFYPLCSEYTCYRQLPSSSPMNLPVAHKVVKEVLCLPFYGALSEQDVRRICEMILCIREVH